jgi:hypothetical protein
MTILWTAIGLAICAVLFFLWRQKRQEDLEWSNFKQSRFTAEGVAGTQRAYEEHLLEEVDLPSGVHGRALYIYRELMRVWFAKLAVARQDDEPALKKLRIEWLDYMRMIDTRETAHLIANVEEKSGETNRARDAREIDEITKQIAAIEDRFAGEIGVEAVDRLRQVRARRDDDFSRHGELAAGGDHGQAAAL